MFSNTGKQWLLLEPDFLPHWDTGLAVSAGRGLRASYSNLDLHLVVSWYGSQSKTREAGLTRWTTESPRWLMKKSRYQEAFHSFCRLRNTELIAARDLVN
jgi:hypothetical protein